MSDWQCARCGRAYSASKIKAVISSRDLCTKCFDDWRKWQATSFRVFMCDILPQAPPPPPGSDYDPSDEPGVFGFSFPDPGDDPPTDPDPGGDAG